MRQNWNEMAVFFTFIEEYCVVIEKNIDKKLANRISHQIWCKRCLKGKFGRGVQIRCDTGSYYRPIFLWLKKLAGKSICFRPEMKINWAHTVAFQQVKCKCQSHRGYLSSEIVFSHDTCHAAEQGNSDSKVFFVRRPQQAKLGMFCPGPEGGNTAHLSTFNGFEPHAMKTLVWMMKLRALSHVRDFAVNIGSHSFQLLTALAAGSFGFSIFGKIGQPHSSTPVSLMFFPDLEFLNNHKWGVALENWCVDRF